ncbi:MAG: ABC transporter ATP-binding protein [Peptococcaceae bacterium]|nr:ABC transporter ATP-binding protein [Peptococcaceae bacterium]
MEIKALNGVDLAIEDGEMTAIMGASGSGKSTLMNVIGCMDRPTGGRYLLDGVDVMSLTKDELAHLRNRKIGFVFQRYNLLPRMSALQNVLLPLVYAGVNAGRAANRALAALEMVGLAALAGNQPNQMSGGQQQRVSIARALINDPQVILADEPTGALDTVSSAEVMTILKELHQTRGVTLVIVTHEADIAAYCERMITMRDGRITGDSIIKGKRGA